MASLDELTKMDGVLFACEFTNDGRCLDYKANADISREMADKAAQYSNTVVTLFNTLAGAFTRESGMNWIPQYGWTYSGGDWTVIVGGNKVVFANSEKADLHRLAEMVIAEPAEEMVRHGM